MKRNALEIYVAYVYVGLIVSTYSTSFYVRLLVHFVPTRVNKERESEKKCHLLLGRFFFLLFAGSLNRREHKLDKVQI